MRYLYWEQLLCFPQNKALLGKGEGPGMSLRGGHGSVPRRSVTPTCNPAAHQLGLTHPAELHRCGKNLDEF